MGHISRSLYRSILDFNEWTPIAIMPRNASQFGPRWRPLPEAPITPREARALEERGHILMANRVTDDGTLLVVKTPTLSLQLRTNKR